jgi:hypothetical protein
VRKIILAIIEWWNKLMTRPKPVKIKAARVVKEITVIVFKVELDRTGQSGDVVRTEMVLNRILDGQQIQETLTIGPGETVFDNLTGDQDTVASGTVIDIDDAGLQSDPTDWDLLLKDNVRPNKVGMVTASIVDEI